MLALCSSATFHFYIVALPYSTETFRCLCSNQVFIVGKNTAVILFFDTEECY